jgi:hypothetical protein
MAIRARRKHPITNRYGGPSNFPEDERIESLLASNFEPDIGYFKVLMKRRHARDLRKVFFGPKGSRIVPEFDGNLRYYDGEMEFELPGGWLLHLTYLPPSPEIEAGDVVAEFIPPNRAEETAEPEREAAGLAEEAHH